MMDDATTYKRLLAKIERLTANDDSWHSYVNGNYTVWINSDNGTKIRLTQDDEYKADRPESIDLKITDYCDMNCPMCHENSLVDGKHASIEQRFIDTLPPYLEVAIGGGNPLSHPDLHSFLNTLKERKCFPSITVNQKHFIDSFAYIKKLHDEKLIHGIGVSIADNVSDELIEKVQSLSSACVFHIIVGNVSVDTLKRLYDKNIKILFLGYKNIRRGQTYRTSHNGKIQTNTQELTEMLPMMLEHFNTVSFDNLALEQLAVKQILPNNVWNSFYMGNDGEHTFYIDMVKEEFAQSSVSSKRFPISDKSLKEMFGAV